MATRAASIYDVGLDRNPANFAPLTPIQFLAEAPLATAYDTASEAMTCNMAFEDAVEGIDAFLGKRPAVWRGR